MAFLSYSQVSCYHKTKLVKVAECFKGCIVVVVIRANRNQIQTEVKLRTYVIDV